MAPLEQSEKDELRAQILHKLSGTLYACSSLTQLTNGTTNFVFRGTLIQPLPPHLQDDLTGGTATSTIRTVIVKHATAFAALNKDFPIDLSRCVVEESMLGALNHFPYTPSIVKVPHLYLFDRETNTLVLEDVPGVVDLKTAIVSSSANDVLPQALATSIGRALGSWLRSFHSWASAPLQTSFRVDAEIRNNKPMRELKFLITYGGFITVLEQFPDVLGDHKKTLEDVRELATKGLERTASDGQEGEWGIIHGDFWTGNVLLSHNEHTEEKTELFIVDWEFAQFGDRAYDIGQMIGDLYERKHFMEVESAVWAIKGFIEGYGALSDEMSFRIAIHTGVQLVTWVIRGPPLHMRAATRERVEAVVRLGQTFILKGWKKDRMWFRNSVLASLFKDD
ncbi:kinase-like domain-containing protein [Xylariales sp. AK1849]|nr:kinase-like domain-containing protein [Xylariales sp. AK1849]